ncbi:hypothetical protein JCM3774_004148 [Rhodotorula dairenensis]
MSAAGVSNSYEALPLQDHASLYPPRPAAPSSSSSSPATPSAFLTGSAPAPRSTSNGKGKERAVPDDADEDGLSFGVRFTDGQTPDLVDLWVGHRETVRDLKRRLRILRPDTLVAKEIDPTTGTETERPRRLRLIQLGRVLPDGVFVVPFTAQLGARAGRGRVPARTADPDDGSSSSGRDDEDEDRTGEAARSTTTTSLRSVGKGLLGSVITGVSLARGSLDANRDELDALEKGTAGTGKARTSRRRRRHAVQEAPVWLHCSVGEPMEDEELAAEASAAAAATAGGGGSTGDAEQAAQPQIAPLQGFDRLREAGFSEQDIENLRFEFRAHAPSDRDTAAAAADEEHQRALEEQWMSGMTGLEEAAAGGGSGEGGHYYSLLKGVCAGFFVPFLPLFFFRTQIFSKRMQIAIVLGIVINLAFGFLRMLG